MAVTRRVHRFDGGQGHSAAKTYVDSNDLSKRGWHGPSRLEQQLNTELAPAERIVGTHYVDGYWVIITESFGLGPPDKGVS